jgi:hypothetical protein
MAGMWTALVVAALAPLEERATAERASPELAARLAIGVAAAAALVVGIVLARSGDELALYALERPTLIVGALVIAALAGTLSAGLARAA